MRDPLSLSEKIDLRGVPCPLNYIRISLLLEKLGVEDTLEVEIDRGEPEETIVLGLEEAGHQIQILEENLKSLRILIICGNEK